MVYLQNPKPTVENIKQEIENIYGIPFAYQHLTFDNNGLLYQQKQLIGYNIKMRSTIELTISKDKAFQFNDLKNKTKQKTYKTNDPKCPFIVKPGLILRAQCKNNTCAGYGKLVCINKGEIKNFQLGKNLFNHECPSCSMKTKKVTNIGYYKTAINIEGQYDDE